MYDSPQSLQDICVDFICENVIEDLCVNLDCHSADGMVEESYNFRFPQEMSEQLIMTLSKKCKLDDNAILLFNNQVTKLKRLRIPNASRITGHGLKVLKSHKICHLDIQHMIRSSVNELISCFSDWTVENLQTLSVPYSNFSKMDKISTIMSLSRLKNLSALDVSNTEFTLHGLEIIAQELMHLEKLDISETIIQNISPLQKLGKTLKYLSMYNLRLHITDKLMSVLEELVNLQHLDLSHNRDQATIESSDGPFDATNLLLDKYCLPNLVSLDISGRSKIEPEDLKMFLDCHPNLRFLGLLQTGVSEDSMFIDKIDNSISRITVAGDSSEEQILESLRRYINRMPFCRKSLFYIYPYTQTFSDVRIDIIKLVLLAMAKYENVEYIQLVATGCLFNLTKNSLNAKIHPHLLRKVVDLTLVAMENFKASRQVQKNSLMILCSDKILQDVTFDRYHCAELVMESLVRFKDPAMTRMSVALCSILAVKISTAQTSSLGAKSPYMERLLSIVKSKTTLGEMDIMMKFTLSALWNLTDESPATCEVFLNLGGLDLFLKVLHRFSEQREIETKVLGLLNNIAEVQNLRHYLLNDNFIGTLRALLVSSQIDVSYFSAGIISHLASDGPEPWSALTHSREELLKELGEAIQKWGDEEAEMVAYRSFTPFFSLLKCFDSYEIQLWSVWAIHHVCSKNPKRYCPILQEENGIPLLNNVVQNSEVHHLVSAICSKIFAVVHTYSQT